jgi:hypothetical protein
MRPGTCALEQPEQIRRLPGSIMCVRVRVSKTAGVFVRMRVRNDLHSTTLFNASKFPHDHRQAPGEQKYAHDKVTESAKVQSRDEIGVLERFFEQRE